MSGLLSIMTYSFWVLFLHKYLRVKATLRHKNGSYVLSCHHSIVAITQKQKPQWAGSAAQAFAQRDQAGEEKTGHRLLRFTSLIRPCDKSVFGTRVAVHAHTPEHVHLLTFRTRLGRKWINRPLCFFFVFFPSKRSISVAEAGEWGLFRPAGQINSETADSPPLLVSTGPT